MHISRTVASAIIVAVRVESARSWDDVPLGGDDPDRLTSRPSHRFRGAATVVEPGLREKNRTVLSFSVMVGRVL